MHTVSLKSLEILRQLKSNNNRDWFNDHKTEFKKQENEVKKFYKSVAELMNEHDQIEKVKPFRIYRDVRFSKDKTPYKTHFSASFIRKKPELRGGYYLHIEPDNHSFIAAGFWDPNKDDLFRARKEFEVDAEEMREVLNNGSLKKHWGIMEGERLKTSPKGFDKEHPAIDLINMKQWVFTKKFPDQEVLSPDFAQTVNEHYKSIRPFFDYMSAVLTTDLNGVPII